MEQRNNLSASPIEKALDQKREYLSKEKQTDTLKEFNKQLETLMPQLQKLPEAQQKQIADRVKNFQISEKRKEGTLKESVDKLLQGLQYFSKNKDPMAVLPKGEGHSVVDMNDYYDKAFPGHKEVESSTTLDLFDKRLADKYIPQALQNEFAKAGIPLVPFMFIEGPFFIEEGGKKLAPSVENGIVFKYAYSVAYGTEMFEALDKYLAYLESQETDEAKKKQLSKVRESHKQRASQLSAALAPLRARIGDLEGLKNAIRNKQYTKEFTNAVRGARKEYEDNLGKEPEFDFNAARNANLSKEDVISQLNAHEGAAILRNPLSLIENIQDHLLTVGTSFTNDYMKGIVPSLAAGTYINGAVLVDGGGLESIQADAAKRRAVSDSDALKAFNEKFPGA